MSERSLDLRVGEVVQIRPFDEISRTLDGEGRLDGLPFMPEMVELCGRRFRVHGRADRTCVETQKQRGMDDTVWLEEARCSGVAHDGCQITCTLFWKEAWLKRVDPATPAEPAAPSTAPTPWPWPTRTADGRYVCQSSEIARATYPLGAWGNLRTYWMDLTHGNLRLGKLFRLAWIFANLKLRGRYGPWRELKGTSPKTPPFTPLGLQPGDVVEVLGPDEIEATLDANGRNRGLTFTYDLLEFSGRKFKVLRRIEKVIDESTGQMRTPQHAVVLDGVKCTGNMRRGCQRCTYLMWREAWLKRADGN